jgi:hypothetical protein
MNRFWKLTLTLLVVLASAPVFAGEPCCSSCAPACCSCAPACCAPTCCVEECAPPDRYYFRIERTEQRCLVDVPVHKWYATPPAKTVCEKATDCNCKEKTTCAEIIPICKEGCKKEEKIKICTTVYIHCGPCMDVKTVQAPAPVPAMPPVDK